MRTLKIPFNGFYNTWELNVIEQSVDSYFQDDSGEPVQPFADKLNSAIDYCKMFNLFAIDYCKALADTAKDKGSKKFKLNFKELKSPREYNFETDVIFCEVSERWVKWFYDHTSTPYLREVAREWFTSRSGFISFYSPDIEDWGDLRDWDCNQLGALFEAFLMTVTGQTIADIKESATEDVQCRWNCNGFGETAIGESTDREVLKKLNMDYEYYTLKEE